MSDKTQCWQFDTSKATDKNLKGIYAEVSFDDDGNTWGFVTIDYGDYQQKYWSKKGPIRYLDHGENSDLMPATFADLAQKLESIGAGNVIHHIEKYLGGEPLED